MDNTKKDDNEECQPESESQGKLSYKRVKHAVNQLATTAIPLHVQLVRELSESIDYLKDKDCPVELRQYQIKAANAIRLLKADLFEIDNLHLKIQEDERELFYKAIELPVKDAVEALSAFMSVHSDVLDPLLDIDNKLPTSSVPLIACDLGSQPPDDAFESPAENSVLQLESVSLLKSKSTYKSISFLRKELLDVHSLIAQFSSLVFRQKENVDSIQSNVIQTEDNIREGTSHLQKARLLKATSFPLTGALIGGLILGPIGAIAGFKIFGAVASVACIAGGSLAGYKAGVTLKKRQQSICDIEMKALTYPSKSNSNSMPDLSVDSDPQEKKDN